VLGSVGIPGSDLFPVPEAPYNLFPYLFLLYLAVTCGSFIVQRLRSPRTVLIMERSINEIHDRFTAFEPVAVSSSGTSPLPLPPDH
jgi:hypothetical protein